MRTLLFVALAIIIAAATHAVIMEIRALTKEMRTLRNLFQLAFFRENDITGQSAAQHSADTLNRIEKVLRDQCR